MCNPQSRLAGRFFIRPKECSHTVGRDMGVLELIQSNQSRLSRKPFFIAVQCATQGIPIINFNERIPNSVLLKAVNVAAHRFEERVGDGPMTDTPECRGCFSSFQGRFRPKLGR